MEVCPTKMKFRSDVLLYYIYERGELFKGYFMPRTFISVYIPARCFSSAKFNFLLRTVVRALFLPLSVSGDWLKIMIYDRSKRSNVFVYGYRIRLDNFEFKIDRFVCENDDFFRINRGLVL